MKSAVLDDRHAVPARVAWRRRHAVSGNGLRAPRPHVRRHVRLAAAVAAAGRTVPRQIRPTEEDITLVFRGRHPAVAAAGCTVPREVRLPYGHRRRNR